jgi:hypothetical protein
VIDRTGHQLDSLLVSDPTLRAIGPSQDGRALLVSRALPFERSQFDVLAYRISGAGRLALRPDTILRNLQGAATVAPDGSLLLASGPTRFEVWALERTGPTAMRFTQRLLASATSVLRGELSPDGSRVLLNRTTIVDGAMHLQVSVLPFAGGGERSVDVPADGLGADWNWDGSRIQLFTFRGQDSITASELALSGGPPHPLLTLPWREMSGAPLLLPGGGVLIPFATPPRFRRVGAPGLPDTTFALPPGLWGSLGLASSPDGSAAVWVGWDAQGDSILVERLSLRDGSLSRLAAFYPENAAAPFWLADGTIIVPIEETAATLTWYRIPTGGGAPVRLGSPPRHPALYTMSRDGRRLVANTSEDSPDIFAIRNFSRLLER